MKNIFNIFTKKLHIRFKISLLVLIFVILGLSSLTTLITVLSINKNIGIENAELFFDKTGLLVENKLNDQINKAIQLEELMKTIPEFTHELRGSGKTYSGLDFMMEALDENEYLYSIYTGKKSGDFLQLIKTSSNKIIIDAHNAPDNTMYILRVINRYEGRRTERWTFLDNNKINIGDQINIKPEYNPVKRPWYKLSQENPEDIVITSPYVFHSLKKPGLTASAKIDEKTVIGIDITLSGLKAFLSNIYISDGTGMMIIDDKDKILAANSLMESTLNIPVEPLCSIKEINNDKYNKLISDKNILTRIIPWEIPGGKSYKLIITAPLSDFLKHQQLIQNRVITFSFVIFLLVIPIVIVSSSSLSSFLEKLALDAERIQHFDYSGDIPEHSPILEFDELSEAFKIMKKTLAQKTTSLELAMEKLKRIIELGIAMSVEKDSEKLVELILKGAKEISHADGGSLYLKNDNDVLDFKIVLNDSLGFEQGGTSANPITMPGVSLFDENANPNYHNVVSFACHKCSTVIIEDAYEAREFDFSGTRTFDKMNGYRSKSFLTVPLKLHGGKILGALQLINCMPDKSGKVVPFSPDIQGFVEALSAEAAAILFNRKQMKSQVKLFESLIQLIANAIDTKNPYTGGHCERVPEIATMLAEAAEKSTEGSLADFSLKSEEDKMAFRIGSWLHDAGKITTPEFIVDKSVKLETINNRIHEIRTRFEVILRDLRIEELEAVLAGKNLDKAEKTRIKKEKELIDDFAFIAKYNIGESKPEPYWLKRLEKISKRTWLSHFDHTIGLSRDENEKIDKNFVSGKAIKEKLLSDKKQHLISHKKDNKKIYEKYRFILPHPKYLYNRGEVYNLSIPYGTLTTEERYKINEHIMQSIVMLDQLPLPKGLSQLIAISGTHHETLNGTGYPRGLTKDKLSIPSRILAIADIFEALTAERPYKSAKTLSEAIAILNTFKESGKIDPELFELFLKSGVYKTYAEKYLADDQIDEVDVSKYLDNSALG